MKLTVANALNAALCHTLEQDDNVILLGEDIGDFGGNFKVSKGLIEKFGPLRIIDAPISESGFTGLAIGAAMMGMRPVVEIIFGDFITLTMDQLVNQGAKTLYFSNGLLSAPIVLRIPAGAGTGAGAQHSQSFESWACSVPGVKVVAPSSAQMAYSLLKASIYDNNPVVFLESKLMYPMEGEVDFNKKLDTVNGLEVLRHGTDITLIGYSRTVDLCLQAAKMLENDGISAQVVDCYCINPIDKSQLLDAVFQTGRVVISHDAPKTCGVGSEIASLILENMCLKAPIARVCGADTPIPFCKELEPLVMPNANSIYNAAKKCKNYGE